MKPRKPTLPAVEIMIAVVASLEKGFASERAKPGITPWASTDDEEVFRELLFNSILRNYDRLTDSIVTKAITKADLHGRVVGKEKGATVPLAKILKLKKFVDCAVVLSDGTVEKSGAVCEF